MPVMPPAEAPRPLAPVEGPDAAADLRPLTPARVVLGRAGASLPTRALLDFTRDHARARDAVHAPFEAEAIAADVAKLGLRALRVQSQTSDRRDYLSRPDRGRRLDPASVACLAADAGRDVVIVIGDGLSSKAVHAHAVPVLARLVPQFEAAGIAIGPIVVATGARVALGDEIGAGLDARMAVMLIGERPGLSAPDSLGAYLTFAPRIGRTDAERNCVSNIHRAGLGHDEAAIKIAWLAREGLARRTTGAALKDESDGTSQALPAHLQSVAKA